MANEYGEAVTAPNNVAPSKNDTLAIVPSESLAVAEIVIGVFVKNVELLAGLVSAMVGATLAFTVMETPRDVVVVPRLSVAFAFKLWVPAVRPVTVIENGAVIVVPSKVVPSIKSTFAIVPSVSLALAEIVIVSVVRNVLFRAGLEIETVGA